MTQANDKILDLWSRRYSEEGRIWGDDSSITAQIAARILNGNRGNVIDIGCGYGRDLVEFSVNGHIVHGLDQSLEGLVGAKSFLGEVSPETKAFLYNSDITQDTALAKEHFDCVVSHRVVHLLGTSAHKRAFARHAANILKPGGLICISARDMRDFDGRQMKWTSKDEGKAEYRAKLRKGHLVEMWDQAKFRKYFEPEGIIIDSFEEHAETESLSNPDANAHFTVMVGYKAPEPVAESELSRAPLVANG